MWPECFFNVPQQVAVMRSVVGPQCSALRLKNDNDITPLHLAAAVGNAQVRERALNIP